MKTTTARGSLTLQNNPPNWQLNQHQCALFFMIAIAMPSLSLPTPRPTRSTEAPNQRALACASVQFALLNPTAKAVGLRNKTSPRFDQRAASSLQVVGAANGPWAFGTTCTLAACSLQPACKPTFTFCSVCSPAHRHLSSNPAPVCVTKNVRTVHVYGTREPQTKGAVKWGR